MTATRFDIVNARERLGIHAWLDTTSGIVAVLLAVQFFTGILLAFYYVPSTDHAYATVDFMQQVVSSGAWIRSLHHYGSQWLALFAFLHVVRLFWREAYVDRNKQWIAAVVLLGLVMAAGGTGYSLPWDARAFFSTRIAEGLMGGLPFVGRLARLWLLGGSEISTLTLSRFFALHVLVIPALIVAVMVWRRLPLLDLQRNAIAAAVVFVALALWSSR
ncbi:MAG TPA: cytochrome b N-terminal domain-containing protein, partial [Pyrinomonadaceae bacterium]|nr:cytochrome b N-terminal domain-containing protein [Pyrinomonadaceae bacterium]